MERNVTLLDKLQKCKIVSMMVSGENDEITRAAGNTKEYINSISAFVQRKLARIAPSQHSYLKTAQ